LERLGPWANTTFIHAWNFLSEQIDRIREAYEPILRAYTQKKQGREKTLEQLREQVVPLLEETCPQKSYLFDGWRISSPLTGRNRSYSIKQRAANLKTNLEELLGMAIEARAAEIISTAQSIAPFGAWVRIEECHGYELLNELRPGHSLERSNRYVQEYEARRSFVQLQPHLDLYGISTRQTMAMKLLTPGESGTSSSKPQPLSEARKRLLAGTVGAI
ncbi:hypothetical protein COY95_05325, partial [Candidatus Woesearchaeota archaeon CG_4_10_14_0_8_um_filter_47_5]